MTITFSEASHSVIQLAQELVDDHHPDLADAKIGFVYRSENGSSHGRETFAGTTLIAAKLRPHLDYDFVIWVSQPWWERSSEKPRSYYLDHELTHCAYSEESCKFYIRPHDVEEFTSMIRRYKVMLPALEDAAREVLQLPLIPKAPAGKVEAVKGDGITGVKFTHLENGRVINSVTMGEDPDAEKPEDEHYALAVALVREAKKCSISLIQRGLRIGFSRAVYLVDRMELEGVVAHPDEKTGVRTVISAKVTEVYNQIQELSPAGQAAAVALVEALVERGTEQS
jgi:DNA segregation ATPase FtsK/SpoIIIE-like protein